MRERERDREREREKERDGMNGRFGEFSNVTTTISSA